MASRPPHGGRGLKFNICHIARRCSRRPPHGGRGLKCLYLYKEVVAMPSSSTRRTWIEMISSMARWAAGLGRPPHGGRGLKCSCRPPCSAACGSSSTRRTWIEILAGRRVVHRHGRSSSTRRTWIEISAAGRMIQEARKSSSTRRTWIEIPCFWEAHREIKVVLHTEDVD